MPTATGSYKFGAAKLTSTDGTGYSSAALTAAAAGTWIQEIRVTTGTAQVPGGTYRVVIFFYDTTTYWERASFSLTNAGDSFQFVDRPSDLVLPSASWSIRFATRTAILAGAELHLTVIGQDIA